MMRDTWPQPPMSQLEHAIATVLACLSMVKYEAALRQEQRMELVADIEKTLQFLRGPLSSSHVIREQDTVDLPVQQQLTEPSMEVPGFQEAEKQEFSASKGSLSALYQVYHTYLHMGNGNTLDAFVVRFNEVMSTLDEVQAATDPNEEGYPCLAQQRSVEDALHRVRGFIADLYYMFLEFVRALTETLEAHEAVSEASLSNTEELSSLQRQAAASTEARIKGIGSPPFAQLMQVFEKHQQLNTHKGALYAHMTDTLLFLKFLEENLSSDPQKRDEIIAQIERVGRFLSDLSQLLVGYESAVSALIRPI
ncbi:hypothetical protein [Ktedonospora formicarum]|uniref:Uncharacterized protein n=1 Tax=Ktedonospora formicarum TaxID=2778364 RepID=A0A8J3MSI1_9CHLR|nr:hypothetical protein [Ktedonospora formicarum]GHO43355.1 hypothetical protein KSX_15180 [Ktedonospora formicarum]